MIRIIVSTCDKTAWMVPGFAYMFNKYWPTPPAVTVIGFKPPEATLPANFTFESMAPVETKTWTEHHREWFARQDFDEFIFLLEDYYINRPVRVDIIEALVNEVRNGDADKADINCDAMGTHNTKHGIYVEKYKPELGIFKLAANARYRASMQPSVWTRQLFMKLLAGNKCPWKFETEGGALTRGALIVAPAPDVKYAVYPMTNMMRKGKLWTHGFGRVCMEDRAALAKLGFKQLFDTEGIDYAT